MHKSSIILSCEAMIEKNDVRKDTASQLQGCHPFFKICTNPVSKNFRRGIVTRLQNCWRSMKMYENDLFQQCKLRQIDRYINDLLKWINWAPFKPLGLSDTYGVKEGRIQDILHWLLKAEWSHDRRLVSKSLESISGTQWFFTLILHPGIGRWSWTKRNRSQRLSYEEDGIRGTVCPSGCAMPQAPLKDDCDP